MTEYTEHECVEYEANGGPLNTLAPFGRRRILPPSHPAGRHPSPPRRPHPAVQCKRRAARGVLNEEGGTRNHAFIFMVTRASSSTPHRLGHPRRLQLWHRHWPQPDWTGLRGRQRANRR